MKTQTQTPKRAPLSIGTTGATPLALRLAALADEGVEYGRIPNVLGLPDVPARGAA